MTDSGLMSEQVWMPLKQGRAVSLPLLRLICRPPATLSERAGIKWWWKTAGVFGNRRM